MNDAPPLAPPDCRPFHRSGRSGRQPRPPTPAVQRSRWLTFDCAPALVVLGLLGAVLARPARGTLAIGRAAGAGPARPVALRLYTYRWLSLAVRLYAAEGGVRVLGERGLGPALALTEIVLSVLLFGACAWYVRVSAGSRPSAGCRKDRRARRMSLDTLEVSRAAGSSDRPGAGAARRRRSVGLTLDWRRRAAARWRWLARHDREVAQVMRLCAEHRVAVVPQGGNTGPVGALCPTPAARSCC